MKVTVNETAWSFTSHNKQSEIWTLGVWGFGLWVKNCASVLFWAGFHSACVFHHVHQSGAYVNCPAPRWLLPACPIRPLLLFCLLSFGLFVLCPPVSINKWDVLTPKMKKDRGKKSQSITLPEKARAEKEQAGEEEREQRGSPCHLFTGMAMSNCVTVINE